MENSFVAYYRVSTKDQEESGLGLSAQRSIVRDYAKRVGKTISNEYTEIESGKVNNRPELRKALITAQGNGSVLVIAKLDRLSRNVAFISSLMESRVKFICCDMPEANNLTIHIFSALAEWERKRISERTREALRAKISNGWKAGNPDNLTMEAKNKAHQTVRNMAVNDVSNRHAFHFILPMRNKGLTYERIAELLNEEGYKTRQGKSFHAQQVLNIWNRFSQELVEKEKDG